MGLRSKIADKLLKSNGDDKGKVQLKHQEALNKPNVNNSLPPLNIRIYCHNVRVDTKNLMKGERHWTDRREGVCAGIFYNTRDCPTLVGLQEVKHNQLHDILYGLGSDWTYFGVGRDDGKTAGEFAPILYKRSEWQLIASETYWLSDSPYGPSVGWDAKHPRIVTVVTLRHLGLGKVINLLNTHYDHVGNQARVRASKLIVEIMKQLDGISVLCGDFNSEKHEEAYKTLSYCGLLDTAQNCQQRAGFEFTDTGFDRNRGEKSIDFIWCPSSIPVLNHIVLPNDYKGVLCSDHRPVTAVIQI